MLDRIDTPILFCNFNRPALTARVFESIRKRRPRRLFLACDGPRKNQPQDAEQVQQVRSCLQSVDWDCKVECRFLDDNAGCKHAMAGAISWAFSKTDRLIILEDDCLPDPTFFDYCGALLDRYNDNDRVMMISGDNFQPAPRSGDSYYFSRWPHIWGWATWRSAWEKFDVGISSWPGKKEAGVLDAIFDCSFARSHWQRILDSHFVGEIDTWDFSWAYSVWENDGVCILPERNLVQNIGFGQQATHTTDAESRFAELKTWPMERLVHPEVVEIDAEADRYTWESIFLPGIENAESQLVQRKSKMSLLRKIRDRLAGQATHR